MPENSLILKEISAKDSYGILQFCRTDSLISRFIP